MKKIIYFIIVLIIIIIIGIIFGININNKNNYENNKQSNQNLKLDNSQIESKLKKINDKISKKIETEEDIINKYIYLLYLNDINGALNIYNEIEKLYFSDPYSIKGRGVKNLYFSNAIKNNFNRLNELIKLLDEDSIKKSNIYLLVGVSSYLNSDYKNGIKVLLKNYEINNNDFVTLSYLGTLYFFNNEYDKSIDFLKKANTINENNIIPYYFLQANYYIKKDYSNFFKYSDIVISKDPNYSKSIYYAKAKVYYDISDFNNSKIWLERYFNIIGGAESIQGKELKNLLDKIK